MSNEFDKYIRQYCHQHKITLEKLAETAGIARGTLYHLLSERSCPKVPHIMRLSQAMGVHHMMLLRLKWSDFDVIEPCKPNFPKNDASGFIDETIPDGTMMNTGTPFTKTWTIQNMGQTVWQNRYLMCMDEPPVRQNNYPDDQLVIDHILTPHNTLIAIPTTKPFEKLTLSVDYTAPKYAGRYISYWKMIDETGQMCFVHGVGLSVSILVCGPGVSF